jgi:HK97 family phage major capsid protein
MKITIALKAFLLGKGLVSANAPETDVRSAALKALSDGKMTTAELNDLCREENGAGTLDALVAKALNEKLAALNLAPAETKNATEKAFDAAMSGFKTKDSTTASAFGGVAFGINPEVKSIGDMYSKSRSELFLPERTRSGMKRVDAGRPAMFNGERLYGTSQMGKAVAQAYFKWQIACTSQPNDIPRGLRMTDHDKEILKFALHECEWTGLINPHPEDGGGIAVKRRKLQEFEVKALLDDATSGGIEIAPIEFDDVLVTTPVLFGELFPLVNVVDVARGRRMKGGTVGNPTFGATGEGTGITAFDTTAFVASFDTTIYVASASMEIGMDFEEDSPTNIGGIIIDKFGEKAMEWYDRVIAVGNGTTEPQGISLATGTTVVPSDFSTSGPPTVSDYEGLMFGVNKAYRNTKGSRNVYIANEVSYRNARAIPVGPADERRVFGMTHGDYQILDTPYKVQNDITNSTIMYANLGYYRLYRRLGVTVRNETGGNYLASRNQRLIVVRLRTGGKLEQGGAAAIMTDAKS